MNQYFCKILFLGCAFLLLCPAWGSASHNCPKPPKKGGMFGLFITTTFLPSATAAAVTRSFNTSGCKEGHASKSFYKPGVLNEYLKDNLSLVAEETAQKRGRHIETLAMLVGCAAHDFPLFTKTLQQHYPQIFPDPAHWSHPEQVMIAQSQILRLVAQTAVLQTSCVLR